MTVAIVTQLVTQRGAASSVIRQRVDRLPGCVWIAAAQAGTDLGRVAGKVLADDVQLARPAERSSLQLRAGLVTCPQVGAQRERQAVSEHPPRLVATPRPQGKALLRHCLN